MLVKTVLITTLLVAISPFHTANEDQASLAESITIGELRDHMFFLASDYLGGRVVGSAGYDIAAEYAAGQFRQAGLTPILRDSKGEETFFQDVPIVKQTILAKTPLTLKTASGDKTFPVESVKFDDLGRLEIFGKPLSVVFVGYGIDEPEYGWDDFEGLDLEGKIAVILMDAPTRDGKPVLPEEINNKYKGISGAQLKFKEILLKRNPAVLLVVADKQIKQFWDLIESRVGNPIHFYAGGYNSGLGLPKEPNVWIMKDDLGKALFEGEAFNPYFMGRSGLEGYKTFELKEISLLIDFKIVEEEMVSRNVVAKVPGTDPQLSREYVIVGAHLDHVLPVGGQVCNGADDNASGSAGVLEIAEAVAMNPPRRTVVFCLFAGEEASPKPRIGSRHFVAESPLPVNDIIVYLNLDMIGRTDERSLTNRSHFVMGSDRISSALKKTIIAVNERTVSWPLDLEGAEQYFETSDHLSFHHKGIPVASFFSGFHEDTHRPTDDPEKIDFEKMQKISQLVYEIAMELANRDEPLKAGKETEG